MNKDIIFTGALDDNRSEQDRAKDYQAIEIASAGPVQWRDIEDLDLPEYPVRDQDGSGSCVAQTLALMLGIENFMEEGRFVELSASDIYQRRSNNGAGMIGDDAMKIGAKNGATLEMFMPSQKLSESRIQQVPRRVSDEQIGPVFKSGGYVAVMPEINAMASYMSQFAKNGVKKPLMTWYRFSMDEWGPEPKVLKRTPSVHHSVTAIDFGLLNGKKVIVTQDSWGLHSTTKGGLRFIGEDFIKSRMTYCVMLKDLRNDWRDTEATPDPVRPRHTFTRTLEYGVMGDTDVARLQDILKHEGLFPTTVQSTGNYLQITAKAVYNWQVKHGVASQAELDTVQGRIVGPKTIKKLNELYA